MPPLKLEGAQTTRRCKCVEAGGGVIINVNTERPFSYDDPCVEYRPTVAYNEKASAAARSAVLAKVGKISPEAFSSIPQLKEMANAIQDFY